MWRDGVGAHLPPIERAEVTKETKLVELCDEERYSDTGDFERSLAECFKGLDVRALKGKDEAGWEAFVKAEGGPHGLVSGWLVEHELEDYLKPTKKAKSGDGSGSGSGNSSSASPGKRT